VNPRTNNFYTYRNPQTGKFVVLPYGADRALGNTGGDPLSRQSFAADPAFLDEQDLGGARFPTLSAPKPMARTIARLAQLPGTEDRLRRALIRVLDRAWNSEALLARLDQIAAQVRASGPPEARESWTPDSFEQALARRRSFIEHRAAEVRAELGVTGGG
jgi:spore coat protein CotH